MCFKKLIKFEIYLKIKNVKKNLKILRKFQKQFVTPTVPMGVR